MVLGKLGAMTLSQARDSARNALALVRDGKDPLEEKRQAAPDATAFRLKRTPSAWLTGSLTPWHCRYP